HVVGEAGEADEEGGAGAELAFNRDAAAVIHDDRPADGQAQAGAARGWLALPGLVAPVPEIEGLWDELKVEFYKRRWSQLQSVEKEVKMPENFARFLHANIERYYRSEPTRQEFRSKERRIEMHRAHVKWLEGQIERLKDSEETLQQEVE